MLLQEANEFSKTSETCTKFEIRANIKYYSLVSLHTHRPWQINMSACNLCGWFKLPWYASENQILLFPWSILNSWEALADATEGMRCPVDHLSKTFFGGWGGLTVARNGTLVSLIFCTVNSNKIRQENQGKPHEIPIKNYVHVRSLAHTLMNISLLAENISRKLMKQ